MPEHHFDPLWVSFEVVKRCADTRGEDFGAVLALEALDAVVRTITDKCMDVVVANAAVGTGGIGAGESVSGDRLFASAWAFCQIIGDNIVLSDDV